MSDRLQRYLVNAGLENVRELNVQTLDSDSVQQYAWMLWNLIWDVITALEEDELLVTDQNAEVMGQAIEAEIGELIDIFYSFAVRAGGLAQLTEQAMSPEDARDGFKRMVTFNARVQRGEPIEDVYKDVSGGENLPNDLE